MDKNAAISQFVPLQKLRERDDLPIGTPIYLPGYLISEAPQREPEGLSLNSATMGVLTKDRALQFNNSKDLLSKDTAGYVANRELESAYTRMLRETKRLEIQVAWERFAHQSSQGWDKNWKEFPFGESPENFINPAETIRKFLKAFVNGSGETQTVYMMMSSEETHSASEPTGTRRYSQTRRALSSEENSHPNGEPGGNYDVNVVYSANGVSYEVTDPDGETHTFHSRDDLDAYLEQQSQSGPIGVHFHNDLSHVSDDGDPGTYTVTVFHNRNGDTYVVTDPDGHTHVFLSQGQVDDYLAQQSEDQGILVRRNGDTEVWAGGHYVGDLYDANYTEGWRNGDRYAASNDPMETERPLQNWRYEHADMSYVNDWVYTDQINRNSSDAETVTAIQNELDRTVNGYDPHDYYYYDDNGMPVLDGERQEAFFRKVQILTNLLIMYAMLMKAQQEARDLVNQEMLGVTSSKGWDVEGIVAKEAQIAIGKTAVASMDLFDKLSKEAQARYDQLVAEAKENDDDCGEKTWDVVSGGEQTKKVLDGMIDATNSYLTSIRNMLDTITNILGEYAGAGTGGLGGVAPEEAALSRSEQQLMGHGSDDIYHGDEWRFQIDPRYRDQWNSSYLDSNMDVDDSEVNAIRERLKGIHNMRGIVRMLKSSASSARNLVHEEMTGVGGRERRDELVGAIEKAWNDHVEVLMEMKLNLKMMETSVRNNLIYLRKKREQADIKQIFNIMSNIVMVAAIILSFIIPPLGIVLGVLAAIYRLEGEWIARELVDTSYKPKPPHHEGMRRPTSGRGMNPIVGMMNQASNEEDEALAQADERYIEKGNDDLYQLDSGGLGELHQRLTSLANIQRAFVDTYKEISATRRLVHMEMTGVGGRETSGVVEMNFESDFRALQLDLDAHIFKLREVQTARNMQINEEKQWDNALRTFFISLAAAGLGGGIGAGIGGGMGFAIGWAIGQAVGGFGAELINQMSYGSFDAESEFDGMPPYIQALRHTNRNSTEARLDQEEYEIYQELLSEGIRDSGNGYQAVDPRVAARMRMALTRLANIRSALAAIQKAREDARAIEHAEMTGIGGRRGSNNPEVVNQDLFENSLRTLDSLVQQLRQKAEIHNRRVDSRRAVEQAAWHSGIQVALAGIGIGTYAITDKIMYLYLINAAMAAGGGLVDAIFNASNAGDDFGDFADYKSKKIHDIVRENDPNSTEARLDQLEGEIYQEIAAGQVEGIGAGNWAVHSGAISVSQFQMRRINNIKEAIAKLQQAIAEARNEVHQVMTGMGGREATGGRQVLSRDARTALQNVSAMYETLEVVSQRHNQALASERQLWMGIVGTAFQVTVDMIAFARQMKIENAATTNEPGAQSERADVKAAAQRLMYVQVGLSILTPLLEYLTGKIFDAAQGSPKSNGVQKQLVTADARESRAQTEAGYAVRTSALEVEAVNADIDSGSAQIHSEELDISAQQSLELTNSLIAALKALVLAYRDMRHDNVEVAPDRRNGKRDEHSAQIPTDNPGDPHAAHPAPAEPTPAPAAPAPTPTSGAQPAPAAPAAPATPPAPHTGEATQATHGTAPAPDATASTRAPAPAANTAQNGDAAHRDAPTPQTPPKSEVDAHSPPKAQRTEDHTAESASAPGQAARTPNAAQVPPPAPASQKEGGGQTTVSAAPVAAPAASASARSPVAASVATAAPSDPAAPTLTTRAPSQATPLTREADTSPLQGEPPDVPAPVAIAAAAAPSVPAPTIVAPYAQARPAEASVTPQVRRALDPGPASKKFNLWEVAERLQEYFDRLKMAVAQIRSGPPPSQQTAQVNAPVAPTAPTLASTTVAAANLTQQPAAAPPTQNRPAEAPVIAQARRAIEQAQKQRVASQHTDRVSNPAAVQSAVAAAGVAAARVTPPAPSQQAAPNTKVLLERAEALLQKAEQALGASEVALMEEPQIPARLPTSSNGRPITSAREWLQAAKENLAQARQKSEEAFREYREARELLSRAREAQPSRQSAIAQRVTQVAARRQEIATRIRQVQDTILAQAELLGRMADSAEMVAVVRSTMQELETQKGQLETEITQMELEGVGLELKGRDEAHEPSRAERQVLAAREKLQQTRTELQAANREYGRAYRAAEREETSAQAQRVSTHHHESAPDNSLPEDRHSNTLTKQAVRFAENGPQDQGGGRNGNGRDGQRNRHQFNGGYLLAEDAPVENGHPIQSPFTAKENALV